MKTANVSVLMATFNREDYISESLDSIINQTRPPIQIIVINDGSTDNTKQILKPYLDKITYLEKLNGGKSSALNLALNYVTSDYIWVFDDDDVAFPDALERHLQALEADSSIDFTYSTYCHGTSNKDFTIIPGSDVKTLNIPFDKSLVKMLENCFMIQQSMLVRRFAFLDTTPYDLELIRSQDYDFLLRLNKKYRGAMLEGPTFYRRYHSGTRGSHNNLIDDTDINIKWYEYEKIAIKKQYYSLELKDYLYKNIDYNEETKRLALIQRLSIMAIKGLWHEFFLDLEKIYQEYTEDSSPLSRDEIIVCQKVLTNPFSIFDLLNNQQYCDKFLASILIIKIFSFRIELAKGLFHNFNKNKDQFSKLQIVKSIYLMTKIIGIKNIISYTIARFIKVAS